MTSAEHKHKTKPWTARRIHLWIGIILAVPMALMAISGTLISMRSVSNVTVPLNWLGAETVPDRLPINAFAQAGDGSTWIGNAQGLWRVAGTDAMPVHAFDGQEVIGLAFTTGANVPVVATRMAVWQKQGEQWVPSRRGRVRQLSTLPDGRVLAILGGRGEMADGKPFVTSDGADWQPFGPAMKANAQLPRLENPQVALHQVMREFHSGAFFFGKGPGEMIWSNLLGWVLTALTLTGLWMWLKAERVKARKRVAKLGPEPAPSLRVVPISVQEG